MILKPISVFYGVLVGVRNQLFDSGKKAAESLEVPVISIGNISLGGTGKTPCLIYVAQKLKGNGKNVGVISRGYARASKGTFEVSLDIDKAAEKFGDEPCLIKNVLKQSPVFVSESRIDAGRELLKKYPETEVILADDAFQHRRLNRELDIVLVDMSRPLKEYKLIPKGRLREPISSLKRADLIIYTKMNEVDERTFKKIDNEICQKFLGKHPLKTAFQIISVKDSQMNDVSLEGKNILCVSGIGNSKVFEDMVTKRGARIKLHMDFADHHKFSTRDVEKIFDNLIKYDCPFFVTTEKDAVKLMQFAKILDKMLVCELGFAFLEGEERLNEKLCGVTT